MNTEISSFSEQELSEALSYFEYFGVVEPHG
jgi:hypothetical protein